MCVGGVTHSHNMIATNIPMPIVIGVHLHGLHQEAHGGAPRWPGQDEPVDQHHVGVAPPPRRLQLPGDPELVQQAGVLLVGMACDD